jgi:hypothetical protein
VVGLHGGPALDGGRIEVIGRDEVVEHEAEARHLDQFGGRDGGRVGVGFDLVDFGDDALVGLAEFRGGTEDFGEIDGGDGDAVAFEDFFRVAHGIESAGTRADGADADLAQALHDAGHGDEVLQVGAERCVERMHDVFRRERVGDAGLAEIVADGNLAAEGVAATDDVEAVEVVGVALHEDGDVEAGELQRVGHALLVAEVRQAHEDAGKAVAVLPEEVGALAGVAVRLDATEFGLGGIEHDGIDAEFGKECDEVGAGFGDEFVGEEIAVADNDTEDGAGSGHGKRGDCAGPKGIRSSSSRGR